MLEQLAFEFITLSSSALFIIFILITLIGFIVAIYVHRQDARPLRRMPYLILNSLVYYLTSLLVFAWLLAEDAIRLDVLWALVLVISFWIALGGYVTGWLAVRRSISAYGNAGRAYFGFVPILNLFLLFKAPLNNADIRPAAVRYCEYAASIFLCFMLLGGAGRMDDIYESILAKSYGSEELDPALQQKIDAMLTQSILASDDVNSIVARIAEETELPVEIDEVTTLTTISADGPILRRTYVIAQDEFEMSVAFRASIREAVCAYDVFNSLISRGVSIEEHYQRPNGAAIGMHRVSGDDCYL
jgi:hypothetical protein